MSMRPTPASGAPCGASSLKCRTITSRAHATRTGFRRCSGAIGPSASHQRSPSASKRSTSSAMRLGDGLPDMAPCSADPIRSALTPRTRAFIRRPHPLREPARLPKAQGSMPRLVMKFGGTSVADVQRIRNVAAHVKREIDAGGEVAVVVSAMAGVTNELVGWCKEARSQFDNAEYDAVVASGELVTAGLLALVLKDIGLSARSWQGWQIPLLTDDAHGSARVTKIDGSQLVERLRRGEIAVLAGFQGLHGPTNRVTTLGRGGSDTSAVALAAAIGAHRCDIYTDVDGVYTTDPRVVSKARRMDRIAFEEMLEMASLGAKVLQVRSVEVAMVHKVKLTVRSSFDDPADPKLGTLICDEE